MGCGRNSGDIDRAKRLGKNKEKDAKRLYLENTIGEKRGEKREGKWRNYYGGKEGVGRNRGVD